VFEGSLPRLQSGSISQAVAPYQGGPGVPVGQALNLFRPQSSGVIAALAQAGKKWRPV
jgi:hypothetical protein